LFPVKDINTDWLLAWSLFPYTLLAKTSVLQQVFFIHYKVKGVIMKKMKLALVALSISSVALFSFDALQTNSIKGTVTPADKAVRAWAVSQTDTLRADIQNGVFEIKDVKAGTYSVIIEAQEPYADTRKKDVVVDAQQPTTDIGEIKLQQK
jgi:hypothetical protein